MSYRDDVLAYFDSDHLMSHRPNATPSEEGNPILETGTAYAIMSWLGEADLEDSDAFDRAIVAFEEAPGLPNKKPRSKDLVTHDDLIGLVVGSKAMEKWGSDFHNDVYKYGSEHGWQFTNNGMNEFESYAKPWHIAFYTLAADQKSTPWLNIFLAVSVLVDAFFGMDSASDKRLTYLILKTIPHKSVLVDLAGWVWWRRIRRVYGSAARIFVMLKGEKHPFSLYCPD